MDIRLRTLTVASIAIAALGLTFVTTPVQPAEKAKERPKDARHCVTDLSKPDIPPTCYDTFTAAIAAATGGEINDAPANSRVAMNDQRLLARMNATDGMKTGDKKNTAAIEPRSHDHWLLIGTIFYQSNFEGRTMSYTAPRACDDALTPERNVAYVGDYWNDDFESIKGFNNCAMKVWEHRDFKGASTDRFWFSKRDLGVLNNEGSSLEFT